MVAGVCDTLFSQVVYQSIVKVPGGLLASANSHIPNVMLSFELSSLCFISFSNVF